MSKFVVDTETVTPDRRPIILSTIALAAFLAGCVQQGVEGDNDAPLKVQKGSCEVTTVLDGQGNVKVIKNWVNQKETVDIPANTLTEFRNFMEQQRQACIS